MASCSDGPTEEEIESAECLKETGALFERRIKPLLEADRPKTCNQCHLSGVDLSLFARDSICETRACLYENGLVDPQNVEDSLVLSWILRANPESELITEQVINEEYEGFKEFLTQLASCSGASCKGVRCTLGGGAGACEHEPEPLGQIGTDAGTGCDSIAMETAFRDNVYVWRGRCYPCHFSDQTTADPTAPRWLSTQGGCSAGSVQTLRTLIDAGYIDATNPEQSLLLRKPLAIEAGGVIHGGGEKFHDTRDFAYQSFLSFIQHWASCVNAGQPY
jgi:hypothetical protein